MSGHSKWHNIQKTKGAADAKRAQAFTKIAREMIVAVKEGGGGDPRSNSKLATVIAKAKAANMPNDNIKRTIDKALGAGNTENYEKIVYEGYGPCGVAVIVETMTDNRNRTAGEIRHYFDKYGGNMGAANCVSWSFDKRRQQPPHDLYHFRYPRFCRVSAVALCRPCLCGTAGFPGQNRGELPCIGAGGEKPHL